jgi:AcrR family transcriptional regulator
MYKKKRNATKKKIVSAAWQLFYDQGYDDTTVDDIIELSGTSKGFVLPLFRREGRASELLSFLFDEKYEELIPRLDPETEPFEKLMFLNASSSP